MRGGAIRVAGERVTHKMTTMRSRYGTSNSASLFPPALRAMLELDGDRITGWTDIHRMVSDIRAMGHPDIRMPIEHVKGRKARMHIRRVPELETYTLAVDRDESRRIRLAAGAVIKRLTGNKKRIRHDRQSLEAARGSAETRAVV
jgi:hypothetical protein